MNPATRVRKVLVVDDDVDIATVLKDRLVTYGFEVETASNGQEAVEYVRGFHPDGVLMDVRMPVMDGLTALKIIKQEFPEVVVVMVTASKTQSLAVEALELGANGYLLKPFDPSELKEKLLGHFGVTK